nr:forkhead box protein D1-like [Penaeus vannamei]
MRRGQMVLVATLSVLVTNVANLVIIQVGENGVFLSESDVRAIVGNNQETTMLIAFWLTTVVTAMGIVVSFFGAQYLFCVVVRGPRVKGRMPVTRSLSEEDLHHRQVHTPPRLRSPSSAGAGEVAAPRAQRRASSVGGGVQVHGMCGVGDHGEADGGGGGSTSGRTRLLSGGSGGGGSSRGSQTGIDNPSSQPETPESCVPYFLRNHRSAWQFILPEVVHEMRQNQQFAAREPGADGHSRTSTLSKASKSSFHPARPPRSDRAPRPGGLRGAAPAARALPQELPGALLQPQHLHLLHPRELPPADDAAAEGGAPDGAAARPPDAQDLQRVPQHARDVGGWVGVVRRGPVLPAGRRGLRGGPGLRPLASLVVVLP